MSFLLRTLPGPVVALTLAIAVSAGAHAAASDSAVKAMPSKPAASAAAPRPAPPRPKLVDINSANLTELKTLPGIGDAEARKIIANRPYLTKSHLITKKVLDYGPYDLLRGRIVAVQTRQPKPQR